MIEGLAQMQRIVEKYMQVKMADELVEKVVHMVTSKMISKGEIIVHVGDMQKEVYFVISGLLRSYYIDINGNDVTIKYDPGVIERVQSQNFDDFKSIFGESKDTPITNTDSIPVDGATNYDLKNFLENKLWKILK